MKKTLTALKVWNGMEIVENCHYGLEPNMLNFAGLLRLHFP